MYSSRALEANPHVKATRSQNAQKRKSPAIAGPAILYKHPIAYKAPLARTRGRSKADKASDTARPVPFDVSTDVNPEVDFGPDHGDPALRKLWERPAAELTELDTNPWLEPQKAWQAKKKCFSTVIGHTELSTVPAVQVATAGTSYNPTFQGHQKLLGEVLKGEIAGIQNLEMLKSKVPKRMTDQEAAEALYNELNVGFADDTSEEEDSDEEGEEGEEGIVTKKPIRAENRKTTAQKNKAVRHKLKQVEMRAAKAKKKSEAEIQRVKAIKRELNAKETELEKRARLREEKRIAALAKPRQLAKRKFKESKPVYKLTEELAGNLRASKPEGNPIQERFNSMQKRNMVEVRIRVKKRRRYQLKDYTKRSYKNYELQEEIKEKDATLDPAVQSKLGFAAQKKAGRPNW